MEEKPAKNRMYPDFVLPRIEDPIRWYAIPVIGGLYKIIILIPVFILLFFIGAAYGILLIINSFYVLFTGRYWDAAYELGIGYFRYLTKVYLFFIGLTNKYPGFELQIRDNYALDMPKPTAPNRLYDIPIFGGLARIILMIPYFFWNSVLSNGNNFGVVISSIPVLFHGRYPESTYEFARDTQRVSLASRAYMAGLSDTYPSFKISMNHPGIKITLIILGILLALMNMGNRASRYEDRHATRSSYEQNAPYDNSKYPGY